MQNLPNWVEITIVYGLTDDYFGMLRYSLNTYRSKTI